MKVDRKKELLKRYLLFIIGLFVNSLGISLIIKADLGSSPISSIPYTVSLVEPLSLGTLTFILNLFLIAGQIAVLRKDFKKEQLLQLPISLLFGIFIDFSMFLFTWVDPDSYFMKMVVLLAGCAILGLGVSLEVIADVVMLSGEAFVQAISVKYRKEFGLVKIAFDSTLMIFAVILSLMLSGKILGVREGTVVAAFLVGMFARFYNRKLGFLGSYLHTAEDEGVVADSFTSTDNLVVTIAREYGSGGREIGRMVADSLGIPFYDRELIDMTAKERGYTLDFVETHEQNISSSILYEMVMQDYTSPIESSLSKDDALFVAQSRIIRKLASEGPCVIVGRCANHVLSDYQNCLKVFIHADHDSKFARIVNEYGETEDAAAEKLRKVDKGRANHYRTYAGKDWKDSVNYDICLNSSFFGIEGTAHVISEIIKSRKM